MNEAQIRTAFAFLQEDNHEGVIYGALKSIGVRPTMEYYEDLIHEGKLAFVEAYGKYREDINEDPQKFLGYAYWRVKCRLLDLLRRETSQRSHHDFSLDNELMSPETRDQKLAGILVAEDLSNAVMYKDLLNQLFDSCTPNGQRYILGCVIHQQTMAELAKMHGVSKAAVSAWKKQVVKRAWELSGSVEPSGQPLRINGDNV